MASEKKPSIYSDRSTIGSSSELDEYGVWVKSEPQDMTSGGAGESSALSDFDADFSIPDTSTGADATDTDGLELPDLDIPDDSMNLDSGSDFSTTSLDELDTAEFDDISLPPPDETDSFASSSIETTETTTESSFEDNFTEVPLNDFMSGDTAEIASLSAASSSDSAQSELSTQLLMKIANELSSIRDELSSLKAEFAGIKSAAGTADEKADAHGGFFAEEEDEKISLTGDELDNILNTADFTEESGADAGELDTDMDISSESAEDVSFDDLSLPEPETTDDTASEELSITDDFGSDDFSMPELESDEPKFEETFDESHFGEIEIEEHKDSEDLKHLREHGSLLTTSAPEDTSYLDEETLAVDFGTDTTEEVTTEETTEETAEPQLDSDLSLDEPQPSTEDDGISLDDSDGISLDDMSMSDEISLDDSEGLSLDDMPTETVEETPLEEDTSLEVSAEDITIDDTEDTSLEAPAEDTLDTDFASTEGFDDISLDLSDAVIDEPDLSGEITEEAPLEEPSLDSLSADDLSTDSLSAEDLPVEEMAADNLSLDDMSLDSEELSIEDTATEDVVMDDDTAMSGIEDDFAAAAETDSLTSESFDIQLDDSDMTSLDDSDMSLPDETASTEEEPVLNDNLDLGEAGALEPQPSEFTSEGSPLDDLSLPMDTFETESDAGSDIAIESAPVEESAETMDMDIGTAVEDEVPAIDSGLDTVDTESGVADANIPVGIRGELKTVLAYMDQLLEALPEEKIEEFAKSEYYDTYKKLFKELGLV